MENLTQNQRTINKYAVISVLICLILALCSCGSKKNISKVETKYIHDSLYIEKRYVDTSIVVEKDTSSLKLLAECDENNNVLIHQLCALQGEISNISPVIRYVQVKDTATNQIKNTAFLDIEATTKKLQFNIQILEEKLTYEKLENDELKEKVVKEKGKWINWFLTGFGTCLFLAFIVFIFIKKPC